MIRPFAMSAPIPKEFDYIIPANMLEFFFEQKLPEPNSQSFNLIYSFDLPSWSLLALSILSVTAMLSAFAKIEDKVSSVPVW